MKFAHIVSIAIASICVSANALAATTAKGESNNSSMRQYKASKSAVSVCATEGKFAGNSDKESTVNVEVAKCDAGAFRIQGAAEASDVLRDSSQRL